MNKIITQMNSPGQRPAARGLQSAAGQGDSARVWWRTLWILLVALPAPASTPAPDPAAIHALLDEAKAGDLAAVRARLDAGMPVDAMLPPRDPRYPYTTRTPLEAAAVYARMEVVELLLARGASLRRDARYGIYPASLHTGDAPELLAALLRHAGPGTDLDADFGPALVRAAANRARGEVRFLLEIGVDPDWRARHEPWDAPAIVRAGADSEILELLLAAGADPTGGVLPYRWSPLFPAAFAGDAALTRRFLDLGVDPHVKGERGNALSMAACATPRTAPPTREAKERTNEVVRLLLEAGLDPNLPFEGRSPLRCAEDADNTELASALAQAGGRSHESLWVRFRRGLVRAGLRLALLAGGGM